MKFIKGFVAALIIIVLVALAFVFSGTYNVAATVPDNAIIQWIYHTTMRRSVSVRADNTATPPPFTDEQIREGFRIYSQTCVYCHGAPGKDPGDIGKGLNPEAPYLADTVQGWSNAELFWIIKNGIKMTGMPAFGPTHKDADIWSLVGFVQRLPKMTPPQYSEMENAPAASGAPVR